MPECLATDGPGEAVDDEYASISDGADSASDSSDNATIDSIPLNDDASVSDSPDSADSDAVMATMRRRDGATP